MSHARRVAGFRYHTIGIHIVMGGHDACREIVSVFFASMGHRMNRKPTLW